MNNEIRPCGEGCEYYKGCADSEMVKKGLMGQFICCEMTRKRSGGILNELHNQKLGEPCKYNLPMTDFIRIESERLREISLPENTLPHHVLAHNLEKRNYHASHKVIEGKVVRS